MLKLMWQIKEWKDVYRVLETLPIRYLDNYKNGMVISHGDTLQRPPQPGDKATSPAETDRHPPPNRRH